jgi:hypothetical protein
MLSVLLLQVAIKLMERGCKITKYVERELINHSRLLHPHIVQVWSSAIAAVNLSRLPSVSTRQLC